MIFQRTVLAAVLSLVSVCTSQTEAGKGGYEWKDDEAAGTADLTYDGKPVLRYMYRYDVSTPETLHDTYKVYHHVFAPGTGALITKGPGGKFTHHRGLFFAWNKTGFDGQSLDFWHCTKGAHQRHAKFIDRSGDADHGSMTAEIHWNDADGKPVIIETRTVSVSREPVTGGWQIDWSSRIASQRGDITLDGDRQHAGFQFRAAQGVADKDSGTFMRPADFPQQSEAIQVGDSGDPPKHINLGWFALSYELDGQRYNVEYFDNPNLPKPSLFSERPYGRFGTFFKTTLKADEPLDLKYRVVVSHGEKPAVEAIQKRYDDWARLAK